MALCEIAAFGKMERIAQIAGASLSQIVSGGERRSHDAGGGVLDKGRISPLRGTRAGSNSAAGCACGNWHRHGNPLSNSSASTEGVRILELQAGRFPDNGACRY